MGERHWRPLLDHIESSMARELPLDGAGQGLLLVSDSADEATRFVLHHAIHRFGTRLQPGRARRILGERSLRGQARRPLQTRRRSTTRPATVGPGKETGP